MASQLEIFVAYSGDNGRARRDEIKALLEYRLHKEAPGANVRVTGDDCLKTRDEWHRVLCGLLYSAHGAVLVLTPDSLEREYQKIEASVLSIHHCLHREDFVLVMVLDGVSMEDVKNDSLLKWLELDRYQQISTVQKGWQERLVTAFMDIARAKEIPATPTARRERWICNSLRGISSKIDSSVFADVVSRHLGALESDFGGFSETLEYAAKKLTSSNDAEQCRDTLKAFRQQHAIECRATLLFLLNVLAPVWIPAEHAQPIAKILLGEQGCRFIALDTTHQLIVQLYLARAVEQDLETRPREIVVNRPFGEDDPVIIAREFLMRQYPDCCEDETALNEIIAGLEEAGSPVVLCYSRQQVVGERFIEAIRQAFPTVALFFMNDCRSLPDRVTILTALDPAREIKIFQCYAATSNVIK